MEKTFGRKLKMSQLFKDEKVVPVTLIGVDTEGSFEPGDFVKVAGTSKGRGFQGVVKRHGFHGGPKTHGQKNRQRAPGSIGSTAPQRVIPGMKMAGRMGGNKVTLRKMKVVEIDKINKIIFLKGAVPGTRGSKVSISK
ncbi:MAG: 50S ribosomal protein L3 [Candidatus Colwellbacteria bacterium]|nr:50S ribosomal protein L3 [Candidatus Colwellbacteria bacterium]MBI3273991.1 50S ribosomal protein L3 [Candidatus Colwellbacteria bacterium]